MGHVYHISLNFRFPWMKLKSDRIGLFQMISCTWYPFQMCFLWTSLIWNVSEVKIENNCWCCFCCWECGKFCFFFISRAISEMTDAKRRAATQLVKMTTLWTQQYTQHKTLFIISKTKWNETQETAHFAYQMRIEKRQLSCFELLNGNENLHFLQNAFRTNI